jgi:hypothetical protein
MTGKSNAFGNKISNILGLTGSGGILDIFFSRATS